MTPRRIRRRSFFKSVAVFLSILLPLANILPPLARADLPGLQWTPQKDSLYFMSQPRYAVDLDRLLAAGPDPKDTDGDGLPDSVEKILGTDPELADSDFDRLDDRYEAAAGLDPLSPDSNRDGLSDYIEEKETPNRDFDGDGIPNAWDADNDNDGVYDALDLSPFASTIAKPGFRFNVHTTGKPMYVNIQLRPRDPTHLRLPFQLFDWQDGDDKGTMQDTDGSKEDVSITPALEVSASELPGKQDLDKYGIYVIGDKAYVPLYTTDHFGSPSALNGRIFYPGTDQAREITLETRLVWVVTGKSDQGIVAPGNPHYSPEIGSRQDDAMGGDLAAADIDANGIPDLVALAVDEDPDTHEDRLSYVIGRDVDENGRTASWGARKPVPVTLEDARGAGVSLTDLDGNGRPEMILMHVENPYGADFFRYRIAWNLDTGGDPTGWSGPMDAPAMGNAHAGAGAAVGDIDGNGGKDLLFAAVDADSGDFRYLVGWNPDAVTGAASSWSPVKTAPGVTDHPAGGGAELTDLDNNGTLDLILMALAAEEGANRMYFRVGWNLDAAGDPESWSQPVKGPYFSDETLGGGIAAVNYNNDDKVDLVLGALMDRGEDAEKFMLRAQASFADSMGNAPINLIKYREDATLTGFTVEENHGSQAGLFYADTPEAVILANTQMAYEFLRGQTALSDVPARLAQLGIAVASDVRSFGHQDEAMAALTGTMKPQAMNTLPPGRSLPMICAMEDTAASVEMGQVQPQNRYPGNTFTVDMNAAPVATAKNILTPWYDTDAREELPPEAVAQAAGALAGPLELTDEDMSNLLDLVMAWNAGESAMSRIGEEMDPEPPESGVVMKNVGLGGKALGGVGQIAVGVRSVYKAAKVIRAGITSGQGLKAFKQVFGSVSQSKVGSVGKMDRFIKGGKAMGWLFTGAMAFYSFFQIAFAHSWSRLGVFSGAVYASLMVAYAIGLWAISLIPGGGILSGLMVLSDCSVGWVTGSGWAERAMKAIVDFFVDVDPLSKVDLQYLDSEVTITDHDENGLDVGDRIEIATRFREVVWRTGPGYTDYWEDSYIRPYYLLAPGIASMGGTQEVVTDEYWDYGNYWFERYWDIKVWITPPNENPDPAFPFAVYLETDYQAYYQECSSGCDVKSSSDTLHNEPSIVYFDVLPKNLDQFLGWPVIRPLDQDWDGLKDLDVDGDGAPDHEVDSQGNIVQGCSPRLWDTDMDGLSDSYEVETSFTNPNNRDSDFDGLPDGLEIVLGSDPNNDFDPTGYDQIQDTDRDGLPDAYEYWGWDISIPVGGTTVPMHVYPSLSDPDADGDGLNDALEGRRGTNPWSTDTDGDGVPDGSEPGWSRVMTPPVMDFSRDMGPNRLPARPLSSLRAAPGATVNFDVWFYADLNPHVPPVGGESEIPRLGVQSAVTGDAPSFLSDWEWGHTLGFFKDSPTGQAPGNGIYFIRHYNYWRDYENRPAESEMPIIGVVNSTGQFGWVINGEDRDGDGLVDLNEHVGWPVSYVDNWGSHSFLATCNPLMRDTDLDGLTDGEEYAAGTDPRDRDTDHDGLTDKQEVMLGSNPLNGNSDNDLYPDHYEFIAGMDLLSNDSDGDGIRDNIILGAGGDPLANLPMVLHDDSALTGPVTAATLDVLANDIYYGAGYPVITAVTAPAHGQAVTDGKRITYTPAWGHLGTDTFSYTATHLGRTGTANVTVTTDVINRPPKAYADTCSLEMGGTVAVLDTGADSVLSNDRDPEGAPLTAVLIEPPRYGSLTLNANGTFVYRHDGTPVRQDRFRYAARDGFHTGSPASVLVNVDITRDTDGDGLYDWQEDEIGTLADNPDTDDDGFEDGKDPHPLHLSAGTALDLDGADDVAVLPDEAAFDFTDAMTVEFWVKVDWFSRDWQALVTKGDNAWSIHRNAQFGNLAFTTTSGSSSYQLYSNGDVNDGKWHHVAAVHDGATKFLYIDGVLQGTQAFTSMDRNDAPVWLGNNSDHPDRWFNGKMDEVRIWNTARSEKEIRDHMHRGLNGDEPGLLVCYDMDAAGGAVLEDRSPNNRDAALMNMDPAAAHVASGVPFARGIAGQSDLRAAWVAKNDPAHAASILTVSDPDITGTDFAAFGHDDGALVMDADASKPLTFISRLNQAWRFEVSGRLSGKLSFDCSGISGMTDPANLRLLVDADGDFTDAAAYTGAWAGSTFTVTGQAFSDNAYYTLAETTFLPAVTTGAISNLTPRSARIDGNVLSDGGHDISARGICWNTAGSPTVDGPHTTEWGGIGPFASDLLGLAPNTPYFARAYATNSLGTRYGGQIGFTTPETGEWVERFPGGGTDQAWVFSSGGIDPADTANNGTSVGEKGMTFFILSNGPAAHLTGHVDKADLADGIISAHVQRVMPGDAYAAHLLLRGQGDSRGYTCGITHDGRIFIAKRTAGMDTELAAKPLPGVNPADCMLKFAAVGQKLFGKAWTHGEDEPCAWQVTAMDADYGSGDSGAGLSAAAGAAARAAFGDVEVTADLTRFYQESQSCTGGTCQAGSQVAFFLPAMQSFTSALSVDSHAAHDGVLGMVETSGAPEHPDRGIFTGRLLGRHLQVDCSLVDGEFTAIIGFFYSDAEAAGVNESDLAIYYYDEASAAWRLAVDGNTSGGKRFWLDTPPDAPQLGDYGVDTASNLVWAVVDHFTAFGIAESSSEGWVLQNGNRMRFGDGAQPVSTVSIAAGNSYVWIADTPAAAIAYNDAAWTGQLNFEEIIAGGDRFTIEVGHCADGTPAGFTPGGPNALITGNGVEKVYSMNTGADGVLSVPAGRYAALRVTNASAAGYTLLTGGLRSWLKSPDSCAYGNATLHALVSDEGFFVTIFMGRYWPASGRIDLACGGHPPAIKSDGRGCRHLLGKRGPALGIHPTAVFGKEAALLRPGESILFTTDGVSETMNARGEFFGERRIAAAIGPLAAPPRGPALLEALRRWQGDTEPSDDVTLLEIWRERVKEEG